MKYLTIHETKVPALGFGTWQLTGPQCTEAVCDAIEIGYRHLDTAQMYENEDRVGEAIRQTDVPRDELFVTTKIGRENVEPDRAIASTHASLDRLDLDYIDLLLIHWPSQVMPIGETLAAMRELSDEGLVRHIGVSNFTPSLFKQASLHATLFCNQVEYHPLLSQDQLVAQAQQMGHMLTAYSPLARGRALKTELVQRLAEEYDRSPAQIALRWLVQQGHVAAIPRAADPHHRRANFDIFDFELADEHMGALADLAGEHRVIDPEWAPAWER